MGWSPGLKCYIKSIPGSTSEAPIGLIKKTSTKRQAPIKNASNRSYGSFRDLRGRTAVKGVWILGLKPYHLF